VTRSLAAIFIVFFALRLVVHYLDPRQMDLMGSIPPHRCRDDERESTFPPQ
jgi:hypothetical protein